MYRGEPHRENSRGAQLMLDQGRAGVRHAATLYGRVFRWARHPVRTVEAEAHHLHEIERTGSAGETPFIAILGVFLFLLPIFVLMVGLVILGIKLAG
jgi:hypothetical protein